ncbi:hypothetical protein DDN98_02965 [Vibrio cholerae]|nr:hypothetical protein [Vibrio cholerae]EGR4297449.1 hypothetical protein [Vibrio cholerae]
MPCIIVGFYWLAKDICEVNEKSGGFSSRRMVGGSDEVDTKFCPVFALQKASIISLILKVLDRFPSTRCDVYKDIRFCHFSCF